MILLLVEYLVSPLLKEDFFVLTARSISVSFSSVTVSGWMTALWHFIWHIFRSSDLCVVTLHLFSIFISIFKHSSFTSLYIFPIDRCDSLYSSCFLETVYSVSIACLVCIAVNISSVIHLFWDCFLLGMVPFAVCTKSSHHHVHDGPSGSNGTA